MWCVHADEQNRMQCELRSCANAVERTYTNSLDANDKLIHPIPHVRNTIASRKRQVVMRKGKSTTLALTMHPPRPENVVTVTLYKKKSSQQDCNNYRGISLISVVGKVLARVILPRLQFLADLILPESERGFRPIVQPLTWFLHFDSFKKNAWNSANH